MNKHERAVLVSDQYGSGLTYGQSIARIVIKQFPDGFDASVSGKIRQITDDALAHVVNALATNGVDKRYIKPFKRGFLIGLRDTFIDYAADCAARALGTK